MTDPTGQFIYDTMFTPGGTAMYEGPYWRDDDVTVYQGDCLDVLKLLAPNSVDAVVTDPPYGLEFMGKEWDSFGGTVQSTITEGTALSHPFRDGSSRIRYGRNGSAMVEFQSWCELWATECLRVLKPGGHLLAFGGTRTSHRLACAIEDAGFEIRDSIAWLYGSGFPKSLDVSKAIDKAAGAEREVVGRYQLPNGQQWNLENDKAVTEIGAVGLSNRAESLAITAPATDAARQWQGWGTAMKPAFEPVVCARKPFSAVPLDWRLVTTVHHALAGLLWLSLSSAKRAETLSASSQAEPNGLSQCVSALARAATDTSHDESAKTATYSSPATESTCLSIVKLWSAILAALSDQTNTSTISMRSSTTTALKILNSLLAPVTSQTTMPPCECITAGQSSDAPNAESSSSDEWANWLHTLSASVPATAIETTAVAVCNALASIADSLSIDQAAASTARQTATTGAASSSGKGAFEPVVVARKPLVGTVAANVQQHGVGALNIDACRVATTDNLNGGAYAKTGTARDDGWGMARAGAGEYEQPAGRWPTNVALDEHQAAELDAQSGITKSSGGKGEASQRAQFANVYGEYKGRANTANMGGLGDVGGASRFFPTFKYEPKAPGTERPTADGISHPTVKPVELMRWLVRLVTPPHGTVLDPFAGSGTDGEAAIHEHKRAILIEREHTYMPIIVARLHKPMHIGFDFDEEPA